GLQIGVRPLEVVFLGEHAQARGAAGGVGAGEGGGVEVRSDQTGGRRGLLDLGDEGVIAAGGLGVQGLRETARGRRGGELSFQGGERGALLPFRDARAFDRVDLLQHVAHAGTWTACFSFVTATRVSRAFLARPLMMPSRAMATPSFRSFTLPAMR